MTTVYHKQHRRALPPQKFWKRPAARLPGIRPSQNTTASVKITRKSAVTGCGRNKAIVAAEPTDAALLQELILANAQEKTRYSAGLR